MTDGRSSPDRPTAAIVLAAGASTRLGRPKQLVAMQGEPLLRRTARMALDAGCSTVLVILGAVDAACRAALADLSPGQVRVVFNQDWQEGMSTSLRTGIEALASDQQAGAPQSSGAVMVLVCDQVQLTAESLSCLLEAHAAGLQPITAARYSGRLGVPAVFSSEVWPALCALTGDQGARHLLAAWADRTAAVEMPEAAVDLDSPEDLALLANA